jgi:hypothetical protein
MVFVVSMELVHIYGFCGIYGFGVFGDNNHCETLGMSGRFLLPSFFN